MVSGRRFSSLKPHILSCVFTKTVTGLLRHYTVSGHTFTPKQTAQRAPWWLTSFLWFSNCHICFVLCFLFHFSELLHSAAPLFCSYILILLKCPEGDSLDVFPAQPLTHSHHTNTPWLTVTSYHIIMEATWSWSHSVRQTFMFPSCLVSSQEARPDERPLTSPSDSGSASWGACSCSSCPFSGSSSASSWCWLSLS